MPAPVRVSLTAIALALVASGPVMFAQGQAPKTQQSQKASSEQDKSDAGMKRADNDMRAVLESLQKLGAKPLSTLTVEQARAQTTPADAVKAVIAERGKKPPVSTVRKENVRYEGAAGQLPARVYTPARAAKQGQPDAALPVIVYYHGGGWVIADLDTYDASAEALA